MTEQELDRWTTLVVAEARGQSLSPAARAERRQIEREHPELRGEASLWAEFAELEQPRAGERDDAAMIASVLAQAREPSSTEQPAARSGRSSPALVPALALLALAASIALALAISQLREHGHEAVDRGHPQPIGGAAMAVDEQPVLQVATPGEHQLRDDDCRSAGASARLCTRERARFRVAERSTEQRVELELDEGQLRVEVGEDMLVEVRTRAGLVRIRGLVDLSFDPRTGKLQLDVIAGEAELIGHEPTPIRLGVGASLGLLAAADPAAPLVPEPEPELEPEPSPASPTKTRPEPAKPSADQLLASAQQALAAGELETAIERYERLIRSYPESRAARTASVSLGRLLLRAGRARDALAVFEQYLDSDARELVEEARYGRIRALRELGRDAEVELAIREFLSAHPGSIHRARLEAWQTP